MGSHLFVANCTQQVQNFSYRLPEGKRPVTQAIAIGTQLKIAGELSSADITAIIEQNAKYGLIEVSEIDRTKPFFGTCYCVDRPISVEKIKRAINHNEEVLVERGQQIREESAVALNNAIEEQAGPLENLEMSVIEETKPGSADTPSFAKGVRVNHREGPTRQKPIQRRNARKG